jgi:phosphoribosylformylglycinamidine (FGAM) synthase-like amidotransferase family enzyme
MTKKVRSIVITGNGTNCEMEMAHACRLAGSDDVDIVFISELLYGKKRLDDYHFLNLPGGFLDGDDLGSAKAGANRIINAAIEGAEEKLYDQLLRFIKDGKLPAYGKAGASSRIRGRLCGPDGHPDLQRLGQV